MVGGTASNRVRLTGENNYMRLHSEENGPMTTRASHWRVLLSPGGPGHVLFLKSDVTDDQGASKTSSPFFLGRAVPSSMLAICSSGDSFIVSP